jgi:hypothetical protein
MVYFAITYYYSSKLLYRIPLLKTLYKPVIASLVMATVIYFFISLHIFIIVIFAIIVYFGMMYLLNGFTKQDLEIAKKIVFRK